MHKLGDHEIASAPLPAVSNPAAAARPVGKSESPVATNSWARKTILSRAQEIGLPSELARQVGSVGLWYYNRIVLRLNKKDALDSELPFATNRYLVPITLAMACRYKGHPVELDRLLRLSGTPTKKTTDTAHQLLARYAQMLAPNKDAAAAPKRGRFASGPITSSTPRSPAPVEYQNKAPAHPRPLPASPSRPAAARSGPSPPSPSPATALAVQVSNEIAHLRSLFGIPEPATAVGRAATRPRQQNTNAWARKRINDLCRSLDLPEPVHRRAQEFYERIVVLHSEKGGAPKGKRLQLSPRLNWSLVYTTIYLGCRFEEHPKDLRDILGRSSHQGSLREIYRLYRFYKRELRITITLVDVRTFILSWLDGFELSELVNEPTTAADGTWLRNRAIAIANRVRVDQSMHRTSTKIIAAGALTTALAERNPPGNLYAFYKAVASFLHMSEDTIRYIVARIAQLM